MMKEMRSRPFPYAEVFCHAPIGGMAFLPSTATSAGGGARTDLPPEIRDTVKNESNATVFLRDGTWLTTWGQGRAEASPEQFVVASFSRDMGRSWTAPRRIVPQHPEQGERASYGILFVVPTTGRVYLLYLGSDGGGCGAEYEGGHLKFVFSDDDGNSWSRPYPIPLPPRAVDVHWGRINGWVNHPPRIMPTGEVVFSFSSLLHLSGRPWQLGAAEVSVLRCDNLLTENDAERLSFTLLPRGMRGIRTDVRGNWDNPHLQRHLRFWNGTAEDTGWSFQEMTLLARPDGAWVGVGRTYLGSPGYTVSSDRGESWSLAEPLCAAPGGPPIPHPMTMCPVAQMTDGRVVLLFTNNDGSARGARHLWDGDGRTRNPQWFVVGRWVPGEVRNGGLVFGSPRILAEVDDSGAVNLKTGISMPHFFERAGRFFAAYNINKEHILLDEIPAGVLDEMTPS